MKKGITIATLVWTVLSIPLMFGEDMVVALFALMYCALVITTCIMSLKSN